MKRKKDAMRRRKKRRTKSGGKRQRRDNSSDDSHSDNNEFNSDSEYDAIMFHDESDEEPCSTTFKKMVQKISVQFPPITEKHALLYLHSVWSNISLSSVGGLLLEDMCWESDSPMFARKRRCCTIP